MKADFFDAMRHLHRIKSSDLGGLPTAAPRCYGTIQIYGFVFDAAIAAYPYLRVGSDTIQARSFFEARLPDLSTRVSAKDGAIVLMKKLLETDPLLRSLFEPLTPSCLEDLILRLRDPEIVSWDDLRKVNDCIDERFKNDTNITTTARALAVETNELKLLELKVKKRNRVLERAIA